MNQTQRIAGILPILDADRLSPPPAPPEAMARHLAGLPISLVQLRAKGTEKTALSFMTGWIETLRTHAPGIRIILNDRVTWVEPLGADGVHVGQEDLAIADCRRHLAPERIIGLSTHTLEEIREAEQLKVDYIGFGPIFGTTTKTDTHAVQGIETLQAMVAQTRLPMVAIGGVDLTRLEEVARTRVASAAMISALWQKEWADRLTTACHLWQKSCSAGCSPSV